MTELSMRIIEFGSGLVKAFGPVLILAGVRWMMTAKELVDEPREYVPNEHS